MADFFCDASDMRALSRELLRADKASQAAFYGSLEAAGHLVEAKAAENLSGYPSLRGTGRVVRRGVSVRISFGDGNDSFARPLEHRGRPGKFRHPVWGHKDRKWADQEAHPFLIPAAHEVEPAVIATVDHAIEKAFTQLGF